DLPFCLCWANENWSRRWDGSENEVLISQSHSPEDDIAFIKDIELALRDKRYIRVNGRPLLIVYRVTLLPDAAATAKRWREYCVANGIGDLYLVAAQSFGIKDPTCFGFDAAVEFPPHGIVVGSINDKVDIVNKNYQGIIYNYEDVISYVKGAVAKTSYPLFKTVFPSWDNEARKPGKGHTFTNSTPNKYKEWLSFACDYANQNNNEDEKFVFINAWNEWAEGAHLEPDRKYGYAYLQETFNVLKNYKKK
ncbi:MAG: glycoside hydrolase family 99-like domain-containing protein, partial [Thermotaleaceae bacterium]